VLCNDATDSLTPEGSAVYIFEGFDVAPDDVDDIDPEPLDTAIVKLNSENGAFEYTAAFLHPGEYTVALSCVPDADDPALNAALPFEGAVNVTVMAGSTTTLDF